MRNDIARYVAPAAILAAATVAILLIRAGLNVADEVVPLPSPTVSTTDTRATTTVETAAPRPARFTNVESGETLGTIADEFDTTVESLVELNPGIDPTALRVGQRVRVR
jgi:LysM repeat protein